MTCTCLLRNTAENPSRSKVPGRHGRREAAAAGQTHPHGGWIRNTALKGPSERARTALESNLWVPGSHLHCNKAADTKEWLNAERDDRQQEGTERDGRGRSRWRGQSQPCQLWFLLTQSLQDVHAEAGGKMERSMADSYSAWTARVLT